MGADLVGVARGLLDAAMRSAEAVAAEIDIYITSSDLQHGLKVTDTNVNIMVVPGHAVPVGDRRQADTPCNAALHGAAPQAPQEVFLIPGP